MRIISAIVRFVQRVRARRCASQGSKCGSPENCFYECGESCCLEFVFASGQAQALAPGGRDSMGRD
jgi:hypothetical protein